MTDISERLWELHTLKETLKLQLQDVEMMLKQTQAEAYAAGIRVLPNGYRLVRSEIRDISIPTLREKHPEVYAAALAAKVAAYNPELTKGDLKTYLRDAGLSEDERAALIEEISESQAACTYALRKPADPHAKEVSE